MSRKAAPTPPGADAGAKVPPKATRPPIPDVPEGISKLGASLWIIYHVLEARGELHLLPPHWSAPVVRQLLAEASQLASQRAGTLSGQRSIGSELEEKEALAEDLLEQAESLVDGQYPLGLPGPRATFFPAPEPGKTPSLAERLSAFVAGNQQHPIAGTPDALMAGQLDPLIAKLKQLSEQQAALDAQRTTQVTVRPQLAQQLRQAVQQITEKLRGIYGVRNPDLKAIYGAEPLKPRKKRHGAHRVVPRKKVKPGGSAGGGGEAAAAASRKNEKGKGGDKSGGKKSDPASGGGDPAGQKSNPAAGGGDPAGQKSNPAVSGGDPAGQKSDPS